MLKFQTRRYSNPSSFRRAFPLLYPLARLSLQHFSAHAPPRVKSLDFKVSFVSRFSPPLFVRPTPVGHRRSGRGRWRRRVEALHAPFAAELDWQLSIKSDIGVASRRPSLDDRCRPYIERFRDTAHRSTRSRASSADPRVSQQPPVYLRPLQEDYETGSSITPTLPPADSPARPHPVVGRVTELLRFETSKIRRLDRAHRALPAPDGATLAPWRMREGGMSAEMSCSASRDTRQHIVDVPNRVPSTTFREVPHFDYGGLGARVSRLLRVNFLSTSSVLQHRDISSANTAASFDQVGSALPPGQETYAFLARKIHDELTRADSRKLEECAHSRRDAEG